MKVGFIYFILLIQTVMGQVLAPQLKCLATNTLGDVTLTWIPPADPGSQFFAYEIHYATVKTGPYSIIGTVTPIGINTYTHVGAAADIQSRFYYVVTKSGPTGTINSLPSDTLRTLFLNLVNPGPGVVGITYNSLKIPPLSTTSSSFTILKEYPAGVWSNFKITGNLGYNDTISVCTASINYRVLIGDNSGCTSISNIKGGLFQDKTGPKTEDIDSISVLPNGQTVIGYPSSPSADCSGYYIYKVINSLNAQIDSVPGKNTTIYTYTPTLANSGPVELLNAPFDSCGNKGILNNPHKTMYLEYTYDKCKYQTTLNWNAYVGMKGGVSEYRIYYSVNGSNFLQIGSTTGTSFVHTNVNPSSNVSYYVRAFNSTKSITSSSNRILFFTFQTPAPTFIYLRTVSVIDDENIALRFFIDSTKTGTGFDIYRSTDGLSYNRIGFVAATGGGNYSYTDSDLKTKEQSYFYKAIVKDSCGNDRTTSNIAQSILLHVTNDKTNFFHKHLTWNNYNGFSGGIAGYNIYRIVNDEFPAFPTGYTNGTLNEYTDNLEDAAPLGSKVEYVVTAIEGATNIYGILETANSNEATAYVEADVFIPTAFAPKGVNKVWRPVTHFVDKSDYSLKIYNRWGNLLFSTNDFNEGWNGNGAPNDVYVYLIDFKNSRGEYIQLKGTFTLL